MLLPYVSLLNFVQRPMHLFPPFYDGQVSDAVSCQSHGDQWLKPLSVECIGSFFTQGYMSRWSIGLSSDIITASGLSSVQIILHLHAVIVSCNLTVTIFCGCFGESYSIREHENNMHTCAYVYNIYISYTQWVTAIADVFSKVICKKKN